MSDQSCPERQRLVEAESRVKHWKRWGPYLAERAWGTVREDYSATGDAWGYFTHEHSRSRAYRWTEDGLLGISDNHQRLCFALALWNGKDPILKERLFGLTGPEGNHGEDVKELYYYVDSTPTHSYMKGVYKYPQSEFPYRHLVEESRHRTRLQPEYELVDTGIFDEQRYFDVAVEYAKQDVDDIRIRITVSNRGPEKAPLTLLPTLWFRNTWVWYASGEAALKPQLSLSNSNCVLAEHHTLGSFAWYLDGTPQVLFTDNETNYRRLFGLQEEGKYYKDAFHEYVVEGQLGAVNPQAQGTKCSAVYALELEAGEERTFRFRLSRTERKPCGQAIDLLSDCDQIFSQRQAEADTFYDSYDEGLPPAAKQVQRQAAAGLFWSKQYYNFVVETWLKGDETEPTPPAGREGIRNAQWRHLFNEDVISMPDKWEYPWYAAWDLAFHTVAMAPADPDFAKSQLALFLREWYMHPNGQIPAYEWAFSDANPPVHAWACGRVFKIDWRSKGKPDYEFLERVFHKLLVNFTWWVNRKDSEENNIFEGGFLGLDNIGIFNRSEKVQGWLLEQSDGTSWMAMYCLNMLKMALHLAAYNKTYEDIASKFFEHFLYIADAINHHFQTGLWDDEDGFYYDRLRTVDGSSRLLRVRSLVGIVPLFATDTLQESVLEMHPGFKRRMQWFIDERPDLTEGLASMTDRGTAERRLLSIVNRQRLERIFERLFDEAEFLSPYGIRSLSKFHEQHPYKLSLNGNQFEVQYEPAESQSGMFGGNSNWRGPVWFPMNYLIIEALQRLNHYYGDTFLVEFPTGSKKKVNLGAAARQLSERLSALFLPDKDGRRPVYGDVNLFQTDPHFKDYIQFYEFFHGDNGFGLGASHQTGWTGLVAKLLHQGRLTPR
jgi:hypothetical protein